MFDRRHNHLTLPLSLSAGALLLAGVLLLSGCSAAPQPTPAGEAAVAAPAEPAPEAMPAGEAEPAAEAMQPAATEPPVLLPVPDDPTVSFTVWFKVGSQDDPPGKEGLAALTASLISEGATEERSYQEILAELYPLASGYSARVDKEMTTLSGRTHGDNLDAYLDLFTAAYLKPAFDEADFERLRSSQLNFLEKTLRYASDEELGKAALTSLVFAGTGYEHPSQGTVEGLQAITLEDVTAFYRRYYNRANAVIGLGGGYTPALVERLEATLGQLPPGEANGTPAPEPAAIEGNQVLLVAKPNADSSISFGFPIDVSRGEDDFYALWLANSWLGEHRNTSSHLYQVIREIRGMNYGDYSYIEAFPQGGFRQFPPTNVARRRQLFEVWIRTLPNEQAHFALRAAVRELKHLVEEGLSEEEFELTQSFLSKYILHFAPTTQARLGYAVDDRFYGIEGEGHLERFREAIAGLTREKVNAAVRRHLRWEDLKIAIVTGDAEGLGEALATDAPSPMSYESEKPPEVLAEDELISTFPLGIDAEDVTIVPVDEIFQK